MNKKINNVDLTNEYAQEAYSYSILVSDCSMAALNKIRKDNNKTELNEQFFFYDSDSVINGGKRTNSIVCKHVFIKEFLVCQRK